MWDVSAIPRRRMAAASFFSNTWAIESARYLFSPRFGRSEQAA